MSNSAPQFGGSVRRFALMSGDDTYVMQWQIMMHDAALRMDVSKGTVTDPNWQKGHW
jgi:hypothetical protein